MLLIQKNKKKDSHKTTEEEGPLHMAPRVPVVFSYNTLSIK